MKAEFRSLGTGLEIFDGVDQFVMRAVERLELGAAVVAFVAGRDAFLEAPDRLDDLGRRRGMTMGGRGAVGLAHVRGCNQRDGNDAVGKAEQWAAASGQDRASGTMRLTLASGIDISPLLPFVTR